eukprot:COSAG04_NODE_18_length_39571_cov_50.788128_10_plen_88_part_00
MLCFASAALSGICRACTLLGIISRDRVAQARRYMTDFLSAVAGNFRLSVLRFDWNYGPAASWLANDASPANGTVIRSYDRIPETSVS